MAEFTLENLEPDISDFARQVVCDVILSWARFDSLVSQLALLAFGLSVDGGTILLGAMNTQTKLERLKKLYAHHGMTDAAQHIGNLEAWRNKFADIRNSIAHHTCAGSWKTDPDVIVFAPVRARKGVLNQVEIEHIPLAEMIQATEFAEQAADALISFVEPLTARRALPPPAPPAFRAPLRPTPPKQNNEEPSPPRK